MDSEIMLYVSIAKRIIQERKVMEIEKVLPHRKPFLFVDEIEKAEYMKASVGYKLVGDDEFWIEGHFPGNPVFPGVLILETMAQIGGFIFSDESSNMPEQKFAYLSKADGVKFVRKVSIGDRIRVEAKLIESFGQYQKVRTVADVNGKKVAEAMITYTFLKQL